MKQLPNNFHDASFQKCLEMSVCRNTEKCSFCSIKKSQTMQCLLVLSDKNLLCIALMSDDRYGQYLNKPSKITYHDIYIFLGETSNAK